MSSVGIPDGPPVERAVLEDETGRRARWLRLLARAVSVLFLVWLLVIVLGGFGLNPADRLPFSGVLRPSAGPPPLRTLPTPSPPAPADLRPALPAPSSAAVPAPGRASGRPAANGRAKPSVSRGKSTLSPGHAKRNGTARALPPGQARRRVATSPGRSQTSPGQLRRKATTVPGKSPLAPGQTKHP